MNIKIDENLYAAIRYNRPVEKIPEVAKKEYKEFEKIFKQFLSKLDSGDPRVFSLLSTLMSMLGYSRKYCGYCGMPVIGKIHRIQNSTIVCKTCYLSYKITEKLYESDEKVKEDDNIQKQVVDSKDQVKPKENIEQNGENRTD